MIDPPNIADSPEKLTAVIHLVVPRAEIQQIMGPGIQELFTTVAEQGIAVTGPWFTHHLRNPSDVFDFEISVPVASPVKEAGRVKPGKLPAAKVARTIYHGSYEGLGQAWGEFEAWIKQQQLKTGPDLWECYAAGPESSSDPAQWRTELNRPLAD